MMTDSTNLASTNPTEATVNPRRRLVTRIRLRGLMLLVLVIGGGLGWEIHLVKIQRDAVEAVEKAGFKVGYRWTWSSNGSKSPWPTWLVNPIGEEYFREVESIYSTGSQPIQVDDEVMNHIARLSHLKTLIFQNVPSLTNDRLALISGLSELKVLSLSSTSVQGSGLVAVTGMKHLQYLMLSEIPITDDSLAHLSSLTSLHYLSSTNCQKVTDEGLAHLIPLTGLQELDLWNGCQVTNKGLNSLTARPKFRHSP